MELISVKPIPTRKWKEPKERWELVIERDKNRKKSQQQVDERIHYIWLAYLKLCLNLEDMKYSIVKKGRGGTILPNPFRVKVDRKIYRDWHLDEVRTSTFAEWYKRPEHQSLFREGGFKYSRGSQYHSLVKRYNVFIEYHNKMNSDYDDETGLISSGRVSKKRQVCEDIIMKLQKERYEQIERTKDVKKSFQSLVLLDINLCEKTIISVCQGSFPKPSVL